MLTKATEEYNDIGRLCAIRRGELNDLPISKSGIDQRCRMLSAGPEFVVASEAKPSTLSMCNGAILRCIEPEVEATAIELDIRGICQA